MRVRHVGRALARILALVLIPVFSLGVTLVALTLPLSADTVQDRPTLTPEPRPTLTLAAPTPASNPTSPPDAIPASPGGGCESICGRVINLAGAGDASGAVVRFGNAGWAIDAPADSMGAYGYGRLGLDVGLLNVVSGEGTDWHPVTHDIALAPPAGQEILVNLGVYPGGPALSPPIVPEASVSPRWANWGEQVVFTVRVQNTLDSAISNVWITDLLPAGMTLAGVTSDPGDIIRSGDYAAAYTGGLAAGEVMTVSIYVDVSPDAPSGALDNTVSLIYSENAAAQAVVRLYVQPAASVPTSIPVTGIGLLPAFGAALGLGLALWITRRLRLRRSAATARPPQEHTDH